MKIRRLCLLLILLSGWRVSQARSVEYWSEHRDALGFTVRLEVGWKVDTNTTDVILLRSGDAWIVVHPFLPREGTSSGQWLSQAVTRFAKLLPQGRLLRSAQRLEKPDEAVAAFEFTQDEMLWRANLLCSINGPTGMLYGVATTSAQFDSRRSSLVNVLRSFKFTEPAMAGGVPQLQFVDWHDPREGAFSTQVPRDWKVNGGLSRPSRADPRMALNLLSPDGQIRVVVGDASMPVYTVPNQMTKMLGLGEGSWYSPGGAKMLIRSFVPGRQFASEYVQAKFTAPCPGLRVTEERDLPEVSKDLTPKFSGLTSAQVSAGEVAFTCAANRGYVFAATLLISTQSSSLWRAPHLYGFLAPASQVAAAHAALSRVINSAQMNLGWLYREYGDAHPSPVSNDYAQITKVMAGSYWARQRNLAPSRTPPGEIVGQAEVVDPETGERWKAAAGHNCYWTGTDINLSPLVEY